MPAAMAYFNKTCKDLGHKKIAIGHDLDGDPIDICMALTQKGFNGTHLFVKEIGAKHKNNLAISLTSDDV